MCVQETTVPGRALEDPNISNSHIDEKTQELLFSIEELSSKEPSESSEKDGGKESKDTMNGIEPTLNEDDEAKYQNRRDPIRWFGFSVPSTLRVAQDKFIVAVVDPIPRILHITKDMRQLENEIGRVRKTIRKLEKS